MPNELLQILVAAFIGAASGYLINQLPPLRTFRGSLSSNRSLRALRSSIGILPRHWRSLG
ncbi:MAG: hypothetical protein V7K26_00020 [Nostoc sp.]